MYVSYNANVNAPIFALFHDDVIKWKYFPRYCFVRGDRHVGFPSQKPMTRSFGAFSLIWAYSNGWANNGDAFILMAVITYPYLDL